MENRFKSGFVSIIGKPNVGKSTILNAILAKKVAIVSSKPETTRDNIMGVLTTKEAQAVFIDTPGIHKPHQLLGSLMVKKAESSIFDADLLLFILELTSGIREDDRIILERVKESGKPAVAVINKIDMVSKAGILPLIDGLRASYGFLDFIPISAVKGDGLDILKQKIFEYLPFGEKYFPDSQITDKDDTFLAAEIIREKALALTRHEVPHAIAVVVDRMSLRDIKDILDIDATIYVERDSQKGILVGRKGDMAKQISTLSRQDLEKRFGKKVFLRIWVKVLKNWRKDPNSLKMLGLA